MRNNNISVSLPDKNVWDKTKFFKTTHVYNDLVSVIYLLSRSITIFYHILRDFYWIIIHNSQGPSNDHFKCILIYRLTSMWCIQCVINIKKHKYNMIYYY